VKKRHSAHEILFLLEQRWSVVVSVLGIEEKKKGRKKWKKKKEMRKGSKSFICFSVEILRT
jgi:hypothetical protein